MAWKWKSSTLDDREDHWQPVWPTVGYPSDIWASCNMILLYNLNLLFRFIADLAQLDVEQIQASGL